MSTTNLRLAVLAVILAALPVAAVRAQDAEPTLKVGSPAPKLHVSEWVQGEKVESFAKDHVYVVEFWATWCGPCRAIIPHMSQLNTKLTEAKAPVTFIGVDIWEDDPAAVKKFVKQMGDKMNYRVAIDEGGEEGKTAAAWMRAAGQSGIPTAFIVGKDGTIQWIGHPSAIDKPLEQIVAGNYDADKQAQLAKERDKIMAQFMLAQQNGDFKQMLALVDAMSLVDPAFALEADSVRFQLLLQLDRYDEAYKLAAELADGAYKDNAEGLNQISWTILDNEGIDRRDYPLALKIAKQAVEVSKGEDAAILDTLARAYFDTGDVAKAVEFQRKAVDKADADMKDELKETLDRYERATQVN